MRCTLLVLVVILLTLAKSQFNNGTQEKETGLIVSSGLVKRSSSIRARIKKRKGRKNATNKKSKKPFGSCDYVRLSGLDKCKNGDQALLNSKLLILKVDQTDIVAFSRSTKKFMKCPTVTDKTAELKCKSVKNLDKMLLSDSAGSGERSYLAGLAYSFSQAEESSPYCAGTLISNQWILTSASCSLSNINRIGVDKVNVILGEDTLGSTSSNYKVVSVEGIFYPPNFNPIKDSTAGNIALWKLAKSVDTNVYNPLCLPKQDSTHTGSVTLVGWRISATQGSLSESIQTVSFDLNPTCTEGLLCAKKEERCQGDHGGPLIQKNQLVGVVSKSLGCSSANSPATFTQVSKYIDWISATMKENGGDTASLC